ncbi:MAG: VWA domain-containing protein [Vicinamibacterales bacterium]|nr:VWA domain-containing protein [Vicinamibacterales bacterium]
MAGPLSFDAAAWLWLLLGVVPFVVWAARRTLTNFPPRQRVLQGGLRGAVLALVILALAQPVWHRNDRRVSVVYLVDVSASVSAASVERAAAWIADASRERAPDHAAVLAFGATTVVLPDVEALGALARVRTGDAAPDVSDTNLGRALDDARAAFAPGHLRRVVLFSDGRGTAGDLARATALLQADGIEVHTVPLDVREVGDVWIDGLTGPARVSAGEPFTIDVALHSQVARSVVVELRHRGEVVALQPARVEPGARVLSLEARVHQEGPSVIEAILRADGDPVPQNNTRRHVLSVGARRQVLYVEGRPASAHHLRTALEVGGFDVTVPQGGRLPADVDALSAFDAVIVSDVEAQALPAATMAALEAYVEGGGGLVLAGGEAVYGQNGYSDTPIERVLPVSFDVKEPPGEVALVIALDRSWSMVGPTLELAKEASKASLDVLEDNHLVGVLAFNFGAEWVSPLQPAANRERIKAQISTIDPAGHTVIYPALEEAYRALQGVEAAVRHVILLSDGRTYEDPYEELITRMARDEITVSTVAVGGDADRELMTNMSVWGKGRAYAFIDAREVPQIFVTETERVARGALDEQPTPVRMPQQIALFRDLPMPSVPALLGYTRTTLRPSAELLLATPSDDPLLARWQYGLGRAVFFASDVKDRWGAEWLRWPGYRAFWTRVLRDVMRRPDTSGGLRVERVARHDGGLDTRFVLDAVDRAGRLAPLTRPRVEIVGQETQTVALAQTAPGRYEATVTLASDQDYIAGARFDGRVQFAPGTPLAQFVLARDLDELRLGPPDRALLESLARDTGGQFDPAPAGIADPGEARALAPRPLWPWLLWAALLLYLVDLLFRRIRVWEDTALRAS